jgi:hypothetical protein
MAYVLDTSMLIDAKDYYYGFSLCPGFWDWLEREAAAGEVLSIAKVRKEILEREDELTTWAKRQSRDFFRPEDSESAEAMRRVSDWVQAGDFTDEAKRHFLAGADPYLIAYALAHHHSVVTHEVDNAGNAGQRKKVKIPTVCLGLGVPSEMAFPWLLRRGAKFVLEDCLEPVAVAEAVPVQSTMFGGDGAG